MDQELVKVLKRLGAQLVDAYHRGMNLEQLTALANGKYTPEQIKIKIVKAGGI